MNTKQEIIQVQDAMDNLALALAEHNHKWTRQQRREYEWAQRTLCDAAERPYWSRAKPNHD